MLISCYNINTAERGKASNIIHQKMFPLINSKYYKRILAIML